MNLVDRHTLQKPVHTAIDHGNFVLDWPWLILWLDEELLVLAATIDRTCGHRVDVTTEFGERLKLAELCLSDLQRAGDLLHTLDLGITTYARYRDTHVDGRTYTPVEEVGLEENLTVGDRDHIGRDVC